MISDPNVQSSYYIIFDDITLPPNHFGQNEVVVSVLVLGNKQGFSGLVITYISMSLAYKCFFLVPYANVFSEVINCKLFLS